MITARELLILITTGVGIVVFSFILGAFVKWIGGIK
jgi:hypothetical protein